MKTKTGKIRIVEVYGGRNLFGDIWRPYGDYYKWEIEHSMSLFPAEVCRKFRWRIAGSDTWHYVDRSKEM